MNIATVATKPFNDWKPGTSGLHRAVTVFRQPHYPENFVQAVFKGSGGASCISMAIDTPGHFCHTQLRKKQVLLFLSPKIPPFQLGRSP